MNKEKTYILQKDLPNSKTGDEWRWHKMTGGYAPYYVKSSSYEESMRMSLSREYVEENPEWFKEKVEEKPVISNICTDKLDVVFDIFYNGEGVSTNHKISRENLAELLIAYENGNLIITNKENNQEKIYTEKEWLQFGQECWNAAREEQRLPKHNEKVIRSPYPDRYETLSDYLNDLKK